MTYVNQSDKQEEAGQPVEATRIPTAGESAAVPVLTPDLPAHGHSAAQAENPDHESPFAAGAVEGAGSFDPEGSPNAVAEPFGFEGDLAAEQTFADMSATQETIDNAEREADA